MDERPIGVFDSGFGGISVLAEAVRQLPAEDFIFLGDNLRAPYGDRTPEEVRRFACEAVDRLVGYGCKAVVIACNTATSAAAPALRARLSLPVVGMEPALKPASLLPSEGAVLVMATAMTLHLEKFHQLMDRYGQNAVPVPCPGLVELIESGQTDGPTIRQKLHELLAPHLRKPVKAVVLGCTHYVFLRPALQAYLPAGVALVDGNEGTVRRLQSLLSQQALLRSPAAERSPSPMSRTGKVAFLSTAPGEAIPARMREWLDRALAEPAPACISSADTVE